MNETSIRGNDAVAANVASLWVASFRLDSIGTQSPMSAFSDAWGHESQLRRGRCAQRGEPQEFDSHSQTSLAHHPKRLTRRARPVPACRKCTRRPLHTNHDRLATAI